MLFGFAWNDIISKIKVAYHMFGPENTFLCSEYSNNVENSMKQGLIYHTKVNILLVK